MKSSNSANAQESATKVFTVMSGGDVYGLPIESVQTIFRIEKITRVPLAPPEVVGLINLRGKINTAASLRIILGIEDEGRHEAALAICIERRSEHFALIVDEIGDVLTVPESTRLAEPPNTDRKRASLTSGVYRLETEILPVLDVDALFDFTKPARALSHRLEGGRP